MSRLQKYLDGSSFDLIVHEHASLKNLMTPVWVIKNEHGIIKLLLYTYFYHELNLLYRYLSSYELTST